MSTRKIKILLPSSSTNVIIIIIMTLHGGQTNKQKIMTENFTKHSVFIKHNKTVLDSTLLDPKEVQMTQTNERTTDLVDRIIVKVRDKTKATRFSSLLVGNYRHALNSTISREIFLHVFFCRFWTYPTNEHFLHFCTSTRTRILHERVTTQQTSLYIIYSCQSYSCVNNSYRDRNNSNHRSFQHSIPIMPNHEVDSLSDKSNTTNYN